MPRVVHFEIHAENTDRATKFYQDVFGWDIQKWDGPVEYIVVMTGPKDQPGINGGMIVRKGAAPVDGAAVNAYVCTMEVSNLDETLTKVMAAGGRMALEKQELAQVGWMAYCKDTEGNIFGLLQPATPAN
jgi:predicted enzyme related to lactoylglutathione lyase